MFSRSSRSSLFFLLGALATASAVLAISITAAGSPTAIGDIALPNYFQPAAQSMSALSLPSKPVDTLPPSLTKLAGLIGDTPAGVPSSAVPGQLTDASSRLLLDDGFVAIYAMKSARGRICILTSAQVGGCASSFTSDAPAAIVRAGSSIMGLVPDSVTKVEAVDQDGTRQTAALQRNAFHVVDANAAKLEIFYADGPTRTMNLG